MAECDLRSLFVLKEFLENSILLAIIDKYGVPTIWK